MVGFLDSYLGVMVDPVTMDVMEGDDGLTEVEEDDIFDSVDDAFEAAEDKEYTAEEY